VEAKQASQSHSTTELAELAISSGTVEKQKQQLQKKELRRSNSTSPGDAVTPGIVQKVLKEIERYVGFLFYTMKDKDNSNYIQPQQKHHFDLGLGYKAYLVYCLNIFER